MATLVAVGAGSLGAGAGGVLGAQTLADTLPVFEVVGYDCRVKPKERTQTGFLVQDVQGITTALHGVVGCRGIKANGPTGTLRDLTIERVDVAHDVAVLNSPELQAALRTGALRPQRRRAPPAPQSVVYVVGFPALVRAHVIDLTVESTNRQMNELFPTGAEGSRFLELLDRRRSPLMTIRVVSLVGPMQPGHSGAPLVDATGKVFAIANGGFSGRSIVWAVPLDLDALRLVSAGSESVRLDRLATDPESEQLFSFADTHVRPLAFRPTVSGAALIGDSGWDAQLRFLIPLWRKGRRISAVFAVGAQQAEFTQSIATLPDVNPVPLTDTSTSAYLAAGIDYRLRLLPDQLVDPYVRLSVGNVLEKRFNPRLDAAIGFDLFLSSFAKSFLELTAVSARLTRERFTFTRLGDATIEESKVWVSSFGATFGLGFAVGLRR